MWSINQPNNRICFDVSFRMSSAWLDFDDNDFDHKNNLKPLVVMDENETFTFLRSFQSSPNRYSDDAMMRLSFAKISHRRHFV